MHSSTPILLGTAYWPLLLAAGALCAIWLARHARCRTPRLDASQPMAPRAPHTIKMQDNAPTVRVDDAQRIDRLHRVVTLVPGQHVDLPDLTFDRMPRLRLSCIEMLLRLEPDGPTTQRVRIHLDLGGAIADRGSLVEAVGVNQFLLPAAAREEQRASILYFYGKHDDVSFLRVKALRINVAEQSVDLDVLHVCSRWSSKR